MMVCFTGSNTITVPFLEAVDIIELSSERICFWKGETVGLAVDSRNVNMIECHLDVTWLHFRDGRAARFIASFTLCLGCLFKATTMGTWHKSELATQLH